MGIILFLLSWVIVGVVTYILTILLDNKQFTVEDLSDLPVCALLGFITTLVVVFDIIKTKYCGYIEKNRNKIIFKFKE